MSGNFERIMEWADQFRTLRVRTNADTPADTANAVKLGAEGIGLCRTEHMFFDAERIPKIRKMILSDTVEQRGSIKRADSVPEGRLQGYVQGSGGQTHDRPLPGSAAA